jgi:hypothetical protein
MTQNKFWLVYSMENHKIQRTRHETLDKAKAEAKALMQINPHKHYVVLEATHHFKADVSVVETDLSAPETPTDIDKQEFKVGDRVKIKDGIIPYMKGIVDTWEIKEILPLSNIVKLEATYNLVNVYLNEIEHA